MMNATIRFYLRLFLNRLPAMAVLIALFSVAGVVAALRLPPSYEAEARLIVETPQIPDSLAASTVQISAAEEIEFIRQRLFTRRNMLEIQNRFRVLGDTSEMSPDDIVQAIRSSASVRSFAGTGTVRRGENRPTLLSVSFTADRAQVTADVVNEFVTRIINENVSLRTSTAEDTLDFFEQEVERLSTELDRKSSAISDFQRENSDALPGDLPYRQGRLTLLQERIASAEREMVALAEQRDRIETAFEQTGGQALNRAPELTVEERQLISLRAELRRALTIYSDTNPTVVNLRSQITLLEEQIAAAASAPAPVENTAKVVLELQLSEIDSRLESLRSEIATTEVMVEELVDSVARTPNVGVTLDALRRDYENVRSQYDRAVQSLSSANMGERIELTSRGQRITLIEPATVPNGPSSPNRPLVAMMGFGMGLGAAAGLFLLLELLNRSIRRPSELVSRLDITPLATIPFIETTGRRVLRRFLKVLGFVITIASVAIGLYAIDTYYLPLELVVQKVLRAAGL